MKVTTWILKVIRESMVGMVVTSTQLYARSYMCKGHDKTGRLTNDHARKSEQHIR